MRNIISIQKKKKKKKKCIKLRGPNFSAMHYRQLSNSMNFWKMLQQRNYIQWLSECLYGEAFHKRF